ncbi:hypothetical protein H4Q26_016148, partial [Puccinia striiformis f. sp. tritici PST-130]
MINSNGKRRTTIEQQQQQQERIPLEQLSPAKRQRLNNTPTTTIKRSTQKDSLKREIAQWQDKYRVAIKSFVFYLDRLDPTTTSDLKTRIKSYGARVDQFFSKDVTHIITDAHVPTNISIPSPSPRKKNNPYTLPSPTTATTTRNNKENAQFLAGLRRNPKRISAPICSPEKSTATTDSVHPLIRKALELKIKIWKSEKLLNVLYRLGDQRSPVKQAQIAKPSLPSLLLKEAQQGHTNEFDPISLRSDYYYFGPKAMFIMVEDTTQEHKPIIVKEYTRPKTRESTSWPIMWGGTEGKSAFSRHTAKQSYVHVRNRIRQLFEIRARDSDRQIKLISNTVNRHQRSCSVDYMVDTHLPRDRTPPITTTTKTSNLRRAVSMNILQRRQSGKFTRTGGVIQHQHAENEEEDDDDEDEEECREIDHVNKVAPDHYRGGHERVFLGASGNSVTVTSNLASATSTRSSAIRSANIGRLLVDKRLAALGKRPTFEINPTGIINSSSLKQEIHSSIDTHHNQQKNRLDILRNQLQPINLTNKLKRCQSLDSSLIARKKSLRDSGNKKGCRVGLGVRAKLGNGFDLLDLNKIARNLVGSAVKSGYCENCRLKYSDFKKHILTRKHRKFALDEDNWLDLDETLKKITRKLKPHVLVPPS